MYAGISRCLLGLVQIGGSLSLMYTVQVRLHLGHR